MTVKIGWSSTRPRPFRTGRFIRGIGLFRYMRIKDKAGRFFGIGAFTIGRSELEDMLAHGQRWTVHIVGTLRFKPDVTPELAGSTISELRVTGPLFATCELKKSLGS